MFPIARRRAHARIVPAFCALILACVSLKVEAQVRQEYHLPPPDASPSNDFGRPSVADQEPSTGDRVASRGLNGRVEFPGPSSPASAIDLGVLQSLTSAMRQVVAQVRPAVVHIEADKDQHQSTGSQELVTEAGSGVVVDIQGIRCILSNYHVVRDSPMPSIVVTLANGRRLRPRQVLGDSATDVAVLIMEHRDLVSVAVGDSDQVQLGDFVLAFGSPFGLSHSVSHGIVSAKGRRNLDLGIGDVRIQDFIQTDAPINPGNSGGPLMNLRGELVGLNTAIASNSGGNDGIAFSIPSNLAMQTAGQLIQHGRVSRPYLGLRLDQTYTPKNLEASEDVGTRGARVSQVGPGTVAAEAGVRVGDVISRVNQEQIEDEAHLRTLVAKLGTSGTCDLTVVRDGRYIDLKVALKERELR